MRSDDTVWTLAVLAAWRADARMARPLSVYATYSGLEGKALIDEIMKLRFGARMYYRMHAKAWLAYWYKPVSDALFDGASDEKALALWRRTRRCEDARMAERAKIKYTENLQYRASLQARAEYARGWRAKHDWGVVK